MNFVSENARKEQEQIEYLRRYDAIVERYKALSEEEGQLKTEIGWEIRNEKKAGIFLIVCLLISCLAACEKEDVVKEEITEHQQEWITTIDGALRDGLAKSYGVNEYLSEEERNKRLDNLIEKIETENWNDNQIVYYLEELISDIHIAHMGFYFDSSNRTKDYFKSYIVCGNWFEDGFYVCATQKENERCLGSRLIAINNHSMEEVLNAYDRILSNETDSYLKYLLEYNTRSGFRHIDLEYLGIIDEKDSRVTFTFEKGGVEFEEAIDAVMLDGSQEISTVDVFSLMEDIPYGKKIYYSNGQQPFVYELDTENRAMYFQYNECYDATYKGEDSGYLYFEQFTDEMIEVMKENEAAIDSFVLDLRNNQGGSELLWNEFIKKHGAYLNQFPIKILMGKQTFSAAVDAIDTTLYSLDDVTLYGEETGLAVHNYTACEFIEFENLNAELKITTQKDYCHIIHKRAEDVSKGVLPDVWVQQSFSDYIAGIDTVYNAAITR